MWINLIVTYILYFCVLHFFAKQTTMIIFLKYLPLFMIIIPFLIKENAYEKFKIWYKEWQKQRQEEYNKRKVIEKKRREEEEKNKARIEELKKNEHELVEEEYKSHHINDKQKSFFQQEADKNFIFLVILIFLILFVVGMIYSVLHVNNTSIRKEKTKLPSIYQKIETDTSCNDLIQSAVFLNREEKDMAALNCAPLCEEINKVYKGYDCPRYLVCKCG